MSRYRTPAKVVNTWSVDIYIGLRRGYAKEVHTYQELMYECQKYCTEKKLGVTVTPTEFVYVNGREPGAIIGLINYARFPKEHVSEINSIAVDLGYILAEKFGQERFTVQDGNYSFLYETSHVNKGVPVHDLGYCDPQCPYLEVINQEDLDARCAKTGNTLLYHDWYVTECTKEESYDPQPDPGAFW